MTDVSTKIHLVRPFYKYHAEMSIILVMKNVHDVIRYFEDRNLGYKIKYIKRQLEQDNGLSVSNSRLIRDEAETLLKDSGFSTNKDEARASATKHANALVQVRPVGYTFVDTATNNVILDKNQNAFFFEQESDALRFLSSNILAMNHGLSSAFESVSLLSAKGGDEYIEKINLNPSNIRLTQIVKYGPQLKDDIATHAIHRSSILDL